MELTGGGVLKTMPAGGGAISLNVLGTTGSSTLTITQVRPRFHLPNRPLVVRNLNIKSGEIGNIIAAPVVLNGVMSPLVGGLSTFDVGALGPRAQVSIGGSVGSMSVGAVDLGPGGSVVIAGDLNGAGGNGSMTVDTMNIDGGQFIIGRDSMASITVAGDMHLSHNGLFAVGRDQLGAFSIDGSLLIDNGGVFQIGRNFSSLTVNGNIQVAPHGGRHCRGRRFRLADGQRRLPGTGLTLGNRPGRRPESQPVHGERGVRIWGG